MDKDKKAVWGWALYDWGNSAFATTVMAGFFPVFFKQYWSVGTEVNVSTAMLGFGNSAASLLVALMAPVLGAIADRGSAKKKFLTFFAYLGVLMTGALFFVGKGQWQWAYFLIRHGRHRLFRRQYLLRLPAARVSPVKRSLIPFPAWGSLWGIWAAASFSWSMSS